MPLKEFVMPTYQTFYENIEKPFFAPPDWIFGVAWGIIYPLIAVAFLYTLYLLFKKRVSWVAVFLFVINLVANALFTPLQLNYADQLYATLDILVILGTLLYLEYYFLRISKLVFYLLLPYLLWGSFATVLQISIYVLNYL